MLCCLGIGCLAPARAALAPEKVTALSKALLGTDAKTQTDAAQQLATDEQTAPLLAALHSSNQSARTAVLAVLPRCLTPEVVEALLPLMQHDPSPKVRLAATQALVGVRYRDKVRQLTARVDDAFFASLKDSSLEVVRLIINVLPPRDARLEPALLDLLAHSQFPAIRSQVIGRLEGSTDARAIAGLKKAINDQDITVSASAIMALGQSGNRSHAALIFTVLKDPARNPEVVYNAGNAMATLAAPDYLARLLGVARTGRPISRMGALIALGGYSDPRAGACLVTALKDPLIPLRAAATQALGQNHYRPAVYPLIAAIKAETNEQLRGAMLGTLAGLGDPRAFETFKGYFNSSTPALRNAAVGGMAALRDPRAVPLLLARLPKADAAMQDEIARALAEIDDPHAIEPLMRAFKGHEFDPQVDFSIRALTGISLRDTPAEMPAPIRIGIRPPQRAKQVVFGQIATALITLYNDSPNALVITGIRSLTDQGAERIDLKSEVTAEPAGAGYLAHLSAQSPGTTGQRHSLASGLLLPGQLLQVATPYRALTGRERLLISYLSSGKPYDGTPASLQALGIYLPVLTGRVSSAGASPTVTTRTFAPYTEKAWRSICTENMRVDPAQAYPSRSVLVTNEVTPIDCTVTTMLFLDTRNTVAGTIDVARDAAAKLSGHNADEIEMTYSQALTGYVVAEKDTRWLLKDPRKPERTPLPHAPLGFFTEADRGPVKIALGTLQPAGGMLWKHYPISTDKALQQPYLVIAVKDLPAFLEAARAKNATLTWQPAPSPAHYRLQSAEGK